MWFHSMYNNNPVFTEEMLYVFVWTVDGTRTKDVPSRSLGEYGGVRHSFLSSL